MDFHTITLMMNEIEKIKAFLNKLGFLPPQRTTKYSDFTGVDWIYEPNGQHKGMIIGVRISDVAHLIEDAALKSLTLKKTDQGFHTDFLVSNSQKTSKSHILERQTITMYSDLDSALKAYKNELGKFEKCPGNR